MMDYDAEFFVLLGFLVFVGVLIYFGVPRMVLKALDARGEAIGAELAQAAKLRQEATSLLASFEKKSAEAEANAAAIVAEARAQAEQLNVEAAERLKEFIARRTKQAEAKISPRPKRQLRCALLLPSMPPGPRKLCLPTR